MKQGWFVWLASIITAGSALAAPARWTTFAHTRVVYSLATDGTTLWAATDGGLARYTTVDRTHQSTVTNVQGLSSIKLRAVTVSRGVIWAGGAEGGLHRSLDAGTVWDDFRLDEQTVTVNAVASWDRNTAYIATDKGVLLMIDGRIKEIYNDFAGKNDVPVTDILIGADSVLWIATATGVYRSARKPDLANLGNPNLQDPTKWIAYRTPSLPSDTALCLARQADTVWVGTRQGVAAYMSGAWTVRNTGWTTPLPVNDLCVSGTAVWAATDNGVHNYTGSQWQALPANGIGAAITAVAVDASGQVWAGTPLTGVWYYNPTQGTWQNISRISAEPLGNFVNSIATEGDTCVWFGGRGYEGMFTYRSAQNAWSNYPYYMNDRVFRITIDDQHNKWYASWGSGLYCLTAAGTCTQYDTLNSPLEATPHDPEIQARYRNYIVVTDVALDAYGQIWVCNWGYQMFIFQPGMTAGRFYLAPTHSGMTDYYSAVDIDRDGRVWLGTNYDSSPQKGAFFQGDSLSGVYSDSFALPSNAIRRIRHDAAGRTWIATDKGLSMYSGASWEFNSENVLLSNLTVLDIDFDTLGNVWAATKGHGVYQFTPTGELIANYTTSNSGLVNNVVQAVGVNRRSGEVWLGTDHGISRFASAFGAPPADNSAVRVYPNPWVPAKSRSAFITFDDVLPGSTLAIFTYSGERVFTIAGSPANGKRLTWDGTNQSGRPVASGVYYYVAALPGAGASDCGVFAIVR